MFKFQTIDRANIQNRWDQRKAIVECLIRDQVSLKFQTFLTPLNQVKIREAQIRTKRISFKKSESDQYDQMSVRVYFRVHFSFFFVKNFFQVFFQK